MRTSCGLLAPCSLPLKSLLLLLPLLFLSSPTLLAQCSDTEVLVRKFDIAGSGWDASTYQLRNSSGTAIATGTLTSGIFGTDTLCLPADCYSIELSPGLAPASVSWEIVVAGQPIDAGGAPETSWFSIGGSPCSVPGCTDPAAPNFMPDATFGDGSCETPADNDICEDAEPLECGDELDGSTTLATIDLVPFCGYPITAPGLWFQMEGEELLYQVSTCDAADFDTRITLYSGTDCDDLQCVATFDDGANCSDGTTDFTFAGADGESYWLLVHGYNGSVGDFTVLMECEDLELAENGLCDDALDIDCGDLAEGTTFGGMLPDGPICGQPNTGAGLWYAWEGDGSLIYLNASSSQVTVQLTIYEGDCSALQCVDLASGPGTCTIAGQPLAFQSENGVSYRILVQALNGLGGNFELTLSCEPALLPAQNDAPCNATSVSCGATETGVLTGVDPITTPLPSCGTAPGVSANWYQITGTGDYITASTCAGGLTGADTRISVFSGSSCSTLTCIGGNDNYCGSLSEVSWLSTPGTNYYVLVHGSVHSYGTFDVAFSCQSAAPVLPLNPNAVPNDVCAWAEPLKCAELQPGTTTDALQEALPLTGCTANITGPGVWYIIEEPCSDVVINACSDAPLALTLFAGTCNDLLCLEASTSDTVSSAPCAIEPFPSPDFSGVKDVAYTSSMSFTAVGGVSYFLLVNSEACANANFLLNASCQLLIPPPNDAACNATPLLAGDTADYDTRCATGEPGEVPADTTATNSVLQSSVWYSFVAPASGCVNVLPVDTGASIVVNAFEITNCSDAAGFEEQQTVAGTNGSSYSIGCLTPGTTYHLQVSGLDGERGAGQLIIEDCATNPLTLTVNGCGEVLPAIPAFACSNIEAAATGGALPYQFTWGDGSTAANRTVCPTFTSTYNATVTDGNGCTVVANFTVSPVDSIAAPATYIATTPMALNDSVEVCLGQEVLFSSNIASTQFSMLWAFGDGFLSTAAAPAHAYNLPGNYEAVLSISSACGQLQHDTLHITVIDLPAPQIECRSVVCAGDSATYCTSDGCGNVAWSIDGGSIVAAYPDSSCITVIWDSVLAGNGLVTLNNGNCAGYCSPSNTISIGVLPQIALISGAAPACIGTEVAYSVPKVAGTIYTWNVPQPGIITSGQGTEQITVIWPQNAVQDTVVLEVSYSNAFLDCSGRGQLSVALLPYFVMDGPGQLCVGITNTSAPFVANGLANWEVQLPNGQQLLNLAIATDTFNVYDWAAGPGSYVVTATSTTNDFCEQSISRVVAVAALPPVPVITGATDICLEGTNTYSAVANTTGVSYSWSVTGGNALSAANGSSIAVSWNPTGPFAINLVQAALSAPGCPSPAAILVAQPYGTLDISGSLEACVNTQSTYSASPVIAGVTYLWSIDPALGQIIAGQGTPMVTISWLATGNTNLEVVLTNCNSLAGALAGIEVRQPAAPEITQNGDLCSNGSNAATLSTSTTSPFEWTAPLGATGTTSSFAATEAGTYTLMVTDAFGCENSSEILVPEFAAPTISIQGNPGDTLFCGGPVSASLAAVGSSGLQYQWYQGGSAVPGADAATYQALVAASFTVEGTDAHGCVSESAPFDIALQPASLQLVTNGLQCALTVPFVANTSGIDSLAWAFGDLPAGQANLTTQTGISTHTYQQPGTYDVVVTGYTPVCTLADTQQLVVPVAANFNVISGCPGAITSFNNLTAAVPGSLLSYAWELETDTGLFQTALASPSVIYGEAGSYSATLTVEWISGTDTCLSTVLDTVEITAPVAAFTISNTALCSGESINFTDASAANAGIVSRSWAAGNGSNGSGQLFTAEYSNAGSYTTSLLVTDANGCTDSTTQQLNVAEPFQPSVTQTGVLCPGDTILLESGGAISYQWSLNGEADISTDSTLSATEGGTYTVATIDANGCARSASIVVTEHSGPLVQLTASPADLAFCDGNVPVVGFVAGTTAGTSYQWLANGTPLPGETAGSYSTDVPGSYAVVATDANGCSATSSAQTIEVSSSNLELQVVGGVSCNPVGFEAVLNGSIQQLTWSFGGGDSLFGDTTVLHTFPAAGLFPVTVQGTDGGCTFTADTLIEIPAIAAFEVLPGCVNAPTTFNDVSAFTSGTTRSFSWDFGNGSLASGPNGSTTYTAAGSYEVVLTVSAGTCSSTAIDTVVIASPSAGFNTTPGNPCANTPVQFAPVQNGLTYAWTFPNGTSTTTESPTWFFPQAGIATVQLDVSDANGCTASSALDVLITAPAPPTISGIGTVCSSGSDTVLLSTSTGGSQAWYDQNFELLSTATAIEVTGSGPFLLVYTDSVGCTSDTSILLSENSAIEINIAADQSTSFCPGDVIPAITFSAPLGTGANLQWYADGTPVVGASAADYSTDQPGDYYLLATAPNGCISSSDTLNIGTSICFSGTPGSGVGLDVAQLTCNEFLFNGTLYGCLEAPLWDLGDGTNIDSILTVQHTYQQAGIYTVNFAGITDSCLVSSSPVDDYQEAFADTTLTLIVPLAADLDATIGCAGTPTSFLDQTTFLSGTSYTLAWDFGDPGSGNNAAAGPNPNHIYESPGLYTITLAATGDTCISVFSTTILVPGPIAGFGAAPNPVCAGAAVQFDEFTVSAAPLLQLQWDFGDGGNLTGADPSYYYGGAGTYSVQLAVLDALGCTDTISSLLTVLPAPATPEVVVSGQLCSNGSSAATLSATASGSISWTDSTGTLLGTGHNLTVSTEGPVTLELTSANGCTVSSTIAVPMVAAPIAELTTSAPTLDFCNQPTFSVPLAALDGPGYAISWYDGATLLPVSGTSYIASAAGGYSIVVSANGCSSSSDTLTVIGSNAQLALTVDSPYCNPIGALADTSGVWESLEWFFDGAAGPLDTTAISHTFSTAGNHDISVLAQTESCTVLETAAVIVPVVAGFTAPTVCVGDSLQFVNTTTFAGAMPPSVTWLWDFGDGPVGNTSTDFQPQHTYASSGAFAVTLTVDDGTCSTQYTDSVIVYKPNADFAISASPACPNQPTQFSVAGPQLAPLVSYAWDFGDGIVSSQAAPQHQYNVGPATHLVELIVTDSVGCMGSATMPVNVAAPTTFGPVETVGSICTGSNDTAELIAPPASAYLWSTSAGDLLGTTNSITTTYPGTYFASVFDTNNCLSILSITLLEQILPASDIITSAPQLSFCNAPIPAIELAAFNGLGYEYTWLQNGDTVLGPGSDSVLVTNSAGVYELSVNSNGCVAESDPIAITGSDEVLSFTVDNSCNPVLLTANASPGLTNVVWDFGDLSSGQTATDTALTQVHHYQDSGIYVVTISATGSTCTLEFTDTIAVGTSANFTTTPACPGDSTQFANASIIVGNNASATYLWNFGDPISGLNNSSTLQNPAHVFATSGSYVVTLTVDDGSCASSSTQTVVIDQPTAAFSYVPIAPCAGSSVAFTNSSSPASIESYDWNFGNLPPGPAGATSSLVNPTHTFDASGTYDVSLTATNALGCAATTTLSVVVAPTPIAGPVQQSGTLLCIGDTAQLIAPTAAAYTWSTGATASTLSVTASGTYGVTVTDVNGCQSPATPATVVFAAPPPVSVLGDTGHCEGTAFGLTSGYPNIAGTHVWWIDGAPIAGGNSATLTLPGTFANAGDYALQYTDPATGCIGWSPPVAIDVFPVPATPAIVQAGTTLCFGSPVTLDVASPDSSATYVWNTGQFGSSVVVAPPISYTVECFNSYGCSAQSSPIAIEPAPDASCVITGCYQVCDTVDSVAVPVPAGFASYTWLELDSTGSIINSLPAGSPLMATESSYWRVALTNSAGCADTSALLYIEFIPCGCDGSLLATVATSDSILCFGDSTGSLEATVTGGLQPYGYSWNNQPGSATLYQLAAGTYCLAAQDLNGCTDTICVVLTEPDSLVLAVATSGIVCPDDSSGSIEITGTGGTAPYGFALATAATPQISGQFNGLGAGSYFPTLTDANGCMAFGPTITLAGTDSSAPVLSCVDTVHWFGNEVPDTLGLPEANDNCGLESLLYSDSSASGLCEGSTRIHRTWTAIDASGISSVCTVVIIVHDTIPPVIICPEDIVLDGCDSIPSIAISATDNASAVVVSCIPALDSAFAVGSTEVVCTATDACGNSSECTFWVRRNAGLQVALCADQAVAIGYAPQEIAVVTVLEISGGTAPYSYLWSSGDTTSSFQVSPDSTTNYTVTVTDAAGCSATATHTVTTVDIRCNDNDNRCSRQSWHGSGGSWGSGSPSWYNGSSHRSSSHSSSRSSSNRSGHTSSYSSSRSNNNRSSSSHSSNSRSRSSKSSKSSSSSASGSESMSHSASDQPEDVGSTVSMCDHQGRTQCVNQQDIPKRLYAGWTLGACDAAVDFNLGDCGNPVLEGCDCAPGIAAITVQYNGPNNANIQVCVANNGPVIATFSYVQSGDLITVNANMIPNWQLGQQLYYRISTFQRNCRHNRRCRRNRCRRLSWRHYATRSLDLACENGFGPGTTTHEFEVANYTNAQGFVCNGEASTPNRKQAQLAPTLLPASSDTDQLAVFPNPFADSFTISIALTSTKRVTATLYDGFGKQVYATAANRMQAGQLEVPLQSLPAGVYFLTVEAGDNVFTRRMVKIR